MHNKDPSISPQSPTNPSQSYDLPVMTMMELPKTHHSEDETPSHSPAPKLSAQTTAVQGEDTTRFGISRGIRGIDAILRTAQDDVVGEYHNIEGGVVIN